MILLAGLGNPDKEYAKNRHNVGFMALDLIAQRHGFSPWRKRFQGEVAEGRLGNEKCLLLKPLTYMNESGQSLNAAMSFFKLYLEDIIVLHDELDLNPGKIKVKTGGGHAGNNGIRSISAHIGKDFRRVRIGIGRPAQKNQVANYVLHDFSKEELQDLEPLLDAIAASAPRLANGEDATFMNEVALAIGQEPDVKAPAKKKKPTTQEKPKQETTPQTEPEKNALSDKLKKWLGNKEDE